MSEWDKIERRKMGSEDHDVMIEIRNDVKHLVGTVQSHLKDDKDAFKALNDGQDFIKRMIWTCTGAITFAVFIINVLVKVK